MDGLQDGQPRWAACSTHCTLTVDIPYSGPYVLRIKTRVGAGREWCVWAHGRRRLGVATSMRGRYRRGGLRRLLSSSIRDRKAPLPPAGLLAAACCGDLGRDPIRVRVRVRG